MEQRHNYKLYQHYNKADNKDEQRNAVHAVHEFDVGVRVLVGITFL